MSTLSSEDQTRCVVCGAYCDKSGLCDPHKYDEQLSSVPENKKQTLSAEATDDLLTGDRLIVIKIPRADMVTAELTKFDYALFDDIEHGEPSSTPIADQLLGLETLVRRIEEATHKRQAIQKIRSRYE